VLRLKQRALLHILTPLVGDVADDFRSPAWLKTTSAGIPRALKGLHRRIHVGQISGSDLT
jgi:hypothetical protein